MQFIYDFDLILGCKFMDDLEKKWLIFQESFMQPKSFETHISNHLFMFDLILVVNLCMNDLYIFVLWIIIGKNFTFSPMFPMFVDALVVSTNNQFLNINKNWIMIFYIVAVTLVLQVYTYSKTLFELWKMSLWDNFFVNFWITHY